MPNLSKPLVVQYLYVHAADEDFFYPTSRARASAAAVAVRYLECALVQAASLSLRPAACELALATNVEDPHALGRTGARLLAALQELGVRIVPAPYRHRPADDSATYVSSRYVLDAIVAAAAGQEPDRKLVLTDLDCVWLDPQPLFDAVPAAPTVGCLLLDYPADWDVVGFGADGRTRATIGALATELDATGEGLAPWVGGELLAGEASALLALVRACEALDARLAQGGRALPTEEQVLSLAGAVGALTLRDLAHVAQRVHTGPRHEAPPVAEPLALSLWHLPAEKGLSLRRTARQLLYGRKGALRRDIARPERMAKRFNVAGTGLGRRLRDDAWIAGTRGLSAARGLIPQLGRS